MSKGIPKKKPGRSQRAYTVGAIMMPDREHWVEVLEDKGRVFPHRYLCVGVWTKDGFTGRVYDYGGGGTYLDECVLDGKTYYQNKDYEDGEYSGEDHIQAIDRKYPGLLTQVNRLFKRLTIVDKSSDEFRLVAPGTIAKEYVEKSAQEGEVMWFENEIKPYELDGGLTYFT